MIRPEDLVREEWAEWYRLTPRERFRRSMGCGKLTSPWEARLSQSPILKVLSSVRKNSVKALLMGGQACVFYGAVEFSRNVDPLIVVDEANLNRQ